MKIIKRCIRNIKKIRHGIYLAAIVMTVASWVCGCSGAPEEKVIDTSDNASIFGSENQTEMDAGDWAGKLLEDYIRETGEKYILVSGDTVRTQEHKITIDRTGGDQMEKCKIVAVDEIERYKEYEGITYQEYVHLTDDRDILQVIRLENKEKSAYVETGNHMFLYFDEDVASSVRSGKDSEKLFDSFITECTD